MLQNKAKSLMYRFSHLPSLYEDGADFVAFDTETTGLSSISERVIEIGAVKFNKNGIVSTYQTLINPQKPIPFSASQINGITDKMVVDAPLFSEVAQDFIDFIQNSLLIAHNANFDIKFMNNEFLRCNKKELTKPNIPAVDTVLFTRKTFPNIGTYKLQSLATYFKIDVHNAHRADDDARVCMEIFLRCVKQMCN